jgi:hypothetical protein
MKVELYDVCRVDAANRNYLGELYPGNSVGGLNADQSAIVNSPGAGNKISYGFTETLNQTIIYTDNGNGWATVAFCAQIALYDGGSLVNLGEVRVQYSIDLNSQVVYLDTYTITDAAGFTDASDVDFSFDGSLQSYFCDPNSFAELVGPGLVMEQGSILSVCFQVASGQFEMSDVMQLTVKNAWDAYPSQDIIIGSYAVSEGVTLKSCMDSGPTDVNICVVQFILHADFYQTSWMELTGLGMVLLELGDSYRRLGGASNSATSDEPASYSSYVSVPAKDQAKQRRAMGALAGRYATKPFQVKSIGVTLHSEGTYDLLVIIAIMVTTGLAGLAGIYQFLTRRKSAAEIQQTAVAETTTKTVRPIPSISLETERIDDASSFRQPFGLDDSASGVHRLSKAVVDQGANQVEETLCSNKCKRIFEV